MKFTTALKTTFLLFSLSCDVMGNSCYLFPRGSDSWLSCQERSGMPATALAIETQTAALKQAGDDATNAAREAEYASDRTYQLQLVMLAVEAEKMRRAQDPCIYRPLVKDLKTNESIHYIATGGEDMGPIYLKDCKGGQ
jgi:hypothetical protein